ncbi:MAG: metallophosphatase domain-containing protein [Tepidisphaeraceae bacterium]|jgi:Icc-related predicted phosphoesterase
MRVVCISDFHGKLPAVPPCDVLLIAGDITPTSNHDEEFQRVWLDSVFRKWLMGVPAKRICGIAGNHDFIFQSKPGSVPRDLRWTYLQDSGVEIEGIKIYGTPWQPWFQSWAFNAPAALGETFLAGKFAAIPEGTDILIAHGAPRGYGDLAPSGGKNAGEHVGSTALLDRIRKVRPHLTVYGHLHGGYGVYTIDAGGRDLILANASYLDDTYQVANLPLQFDILRGRRGISISQVG